MNRTMTASDVQQLIKRIKKKIRQPFLRTTVIVGFPGETDEDFDKLLEFFDEYAFHRIGVFPYSREEPAPASRLPNQVPGEIIVERLNRINEDAQKIMLSLSSDFIDKTYDVLIEGTDPDDPSVIMARPWFFAPEIDGYILIYDSGSHAKGQFRKVRITDAVGVDLVGEFV
jgi:ribosomal protein S12 methylthiotransferase